ncbi:MAG: hypothetical protein M3O71_01195 [Bacteroidota bacterium]|nr:hypothetical protein [Bacteroidota bacterium]
MTYYTKLTQWFYSEILFLAFPILYEVKSYHQTGKFDFYGFLVTLLIWCVFLRPVLTIFFLKVLKRPILTANDTFIFDHYEGFKYYWKDIEEIVEEDGKILYVHLYEPRKYVNQIPFYRLREFVKYKVFKIKPNFSIDMTLIKIKKGEHKLFLEKLDDCSLASTIS